MIKLISGTEELYETLIELENERVAYKKNSQESESLLKGLKRLVDGGHEEKLLLDIIIILRDIIGCEDIIVMVMDAHDRLITRETTSSDYYAMEIEPKAFMNRVLKGELSISFNLQSIPEWQLKSEEMIARLKSALHIGLGFNEQKSLLICCDSRPKFFNRSHADLVRRYSTLVTQALINIHSKERIDKLNSDLLNMAHQAGMAEVAISVLHNIGNVLNSVGVSVSMLKENMNKPIYKKVTQVAVMLKDHESSLIDYFQTDEQGQLLLRYLVVLFKEIEQNKSVLDVEVNHLQKQFNIISSVLEAENRAVTRAPVTEKVILSELVELSIPIILTEESMLTQNITIKKDYRYNSFIMTDKIHLMQLIINLLKNAKESIMAVQEDCPRKIFISIEVKASTEQVELRVRDNGVGISPENMLKIFTFGFSTKIKGHGYGLHNGALIAKQLGGSLQVESEGIGKGAEFILLLPVFKESNLENKWSDKGKS